MTDENSFLEVFEEKQGFFVCENNEKLSLFHQSKKKYVIYIISNKEKQYAKLFLYQRGSHPHLLKRFAFVPVLVKFEEEKEFLVVYKKRKDSTYYNDEIGVFKIDPKSKRLLEKTQLKINFSDYWSEICGKEAPILKDMIIVPSRLDLICLRKDGVLFMVNMQSKRIEQTNRKLHLFTQKKSKTNGDISNIQMFVSDLSLILVYFSESKKKWVIEGCLLSKRKIDKKKYSLFHTIQEYTIEDSKKDAKFTLLQKYNKTYLFMYEPETYRFRDFFLDIKVFQSKIRQEYALEGLKERKNHKLNFLLDYLYHGFSKFSSDNAFMEYPSKSISLLYEENGNGKSFKSEVKKYLKNLKTKMIQNGKNLNSLTIGKTTSFRRFKKNCISITKQKKDEELSDEESDSEGDWEGNKLGNFIQILICLVPIQIARHSFEIFKPLSNGKEIDFRRVSKKQEKFILSVGELAKRINFGLYETILNFSKKRSFCSSMCRKSKFWKKYFVE